MLQLTLGIQEAHYSDDQYKVAIALANLANAHADLSNPAMARDMPQRTMTTQKVHYGAVYYTVAIRLGNLASAHGDLGDPASKGTYCSGR